MLAPLLSRRSLRARALSSVLAAAAFAVGSLALEHAARADYDVLASPCDDDPWTCESGPISFDRTDKLPIEFAFDTGWVPQSSPLQVHVWAGLYAHTRVSLTGALDTTWPEALVLTTPGDPEGGHLSFHYGLDTGAEAKVNISVGGANYSWQGDIPYVPQIDFQVEGKSTFDAWAFDPPVLLSSKTATQKIAQVSVANLIGAKIPGIDGGFELDAAVELDVAYQTDRIVLETTDGMPVSGGPITTEDGSSKTPYLGGPSAEIDVHPEGTVDYDGVLHLIPAFYVSLLGKDWNIPIVDIPIPFGITQADWVFDTQRVHVPLPDLVVPEDVIEFGEVEVGQKLLKEYSLLDAGEAAVNVAITSSDIENFVAFDDGAEIPGGETFATSVRFQPMKAGEFTAELTFASNDPSDPVQHVLVHGIAYDGIVKASVEAPAGFDAGDEGSCACRAAGGETEHGGSAAFVALGALGLAAMRRRRRS
jgi:MYXO-CTERM domain-containing protein